ncbi:TetR/AcrR family transcriptional regulator [Sandaracinus amylolyticus]|uniref:TetR/AcrR family transcriptional regulator n=1 Tax=Sandaracinus amylolyticus TaxID=927083 RepID=UPI001F2B7609|nr:helix-turn-helix domain-containing protein [Sandaracinus amylolyticus]UJR81978.1 Regulatory protein TetR [Sandaracinus amylolyticus]
MEESSRLTSKGLATRQRIVEAAADLVLARGVGATTLDDIRAGTSTSKSQLFHYFPGGKNELVAAIAVFQSERLLDAQRPHLDALDTWPSWEAWRDAVVAHYASQPHWGCPIGALVSELSRSDPELAAIAKAQMDKWQGHLRRGLARMRRAERLRPDASPTRLALATFASLQGGLLLTHAAESIAPLEAALDGALVALRAHAA